jgi:integrase
VAIRLRIVNAHPKEVDSCVGEYLADQELAGLRPVTRYQHNTLLGRLSRHISPTQLRDATSDQLRDFLLRSKANGQPLSQGTRAGEASWLRSYFGWLQRTGRRADDPTEGMPRPKQPKRLPRPIGEHDLEMAITLADTRMTAWLRLAAYAGLRAAEISMLRGENIMLSQRLIVVAEGKGGRPGVVPAHQSVLEALTNYGLPDSGWVFPHSYKQREPDQAMVGLDQGSRLPQSMRDRRHPPPATTPVRHRHLPDKRA